MTEVREITRSALRRESSVISSSVMASAKYSCAGSPERFCNGRTAMERIWGRSPLPPGILPPFVGCKPRNSKKQNDGAKANQDA